MFWAFIVNPAAGAGFSMRAMKLLEEKLKNRGIEYRIYETDKPGHATELAATLSGKTDVKAVVSVGGDGTAGEVAAGLTGTGKPMGIIPAGTGNDFIKSAGIPNDPEKALEILLSNEPKPTDTGTVNDQFFLNVCGTGFDVTVLDYAEAEKQKYRGLLPYFLGLLKAIFHFRNITLEVAADDYSVTGKFLVCSVANGRFIGGGIPICPKAEIDDGMLDLVLIRSRHRWQIPFYLPGLMMSRDLKFRITTHKKASWIRISGDSIRVNIDGEIRPMKEVKFGINPRSLLLIR